MGGCCGPVRRSVKSVFCSNKAFHQSDFWPGPWCQGGVAESRGCRGGVAESRGCRGRVAETRGSQVMETDNV